MSNAKVRLYVVHPLAVGQSVPLSVDRANYLFNVMRLRNGDSILVFNGQDGEWQAQIAESGKRGGALLCLQQTKFTQMPPDLWLLFAPVKKVRTDFIVEKAVELGVARIQPVQTEFTNAERVRQDKLSTHAIEAAEQCGATFVPAVAELMPLSKLLDTWPQDRELVFCDERLAGLAAGVPRSQKAAILIGPEGGFSKAEQARLHAMPNAIPISLGPRILRAETAALAAITLWQSTLGDWA
jgi:16S rRNA (uracil1498-N3)-methyltransferase